MGLVDIKPRIPEKELMCSGHLACPGCGASLSMRYALKALGEKTMVIIPACCWSIIAGPFPYSAVNVPVFHTAFETAAAVASGMKAALDIKGKSDVTVMAWAGDGGTFDIGFQALSGAAERNEDFIYVCYDNEAYMNTGIQRSSSTPYGAWTTTTPERHLKERPKKNIVEIMAAHNIPYIATLSVAYPEDFIKKLQKAKTYRGTKFLHIFSPCPPGWKIQDEQSIRISQMAVHSNIFPLYEIEDGEKYSLTMKSKGTPVKEYLQAQGRFRKLKEEHFDEIQKAVDLNWKKLMKKVNDSN
jgi:pyruvate/2-oxoacid:ferredoxin oxidoreductase beta subunit